jgi:hypothetical protein
LLMAVIPRPFSLAAVAAASLLLLTGLDAYRQGGTRAERTTAIAVAIEADAVEPRACSIDHARFGGQRAQLVRVTRGDVANYVVLEVGKRDPTMRARRVQWLRAAYGEAEHTWLGEFASADAALAGAARLCPPQVRCMPGEPDCGRITAIATPAQVFFGQ